MFELETDPEVRVALLARIYGALMVTLVPLSLLFDWLVAGPLAGFPARPWFVFAFGGLVAVVATMATVVGAGAVKVVVAGHPRALWREAFLWRLVKTLGSSCLRYVLPGCLLASIGAAVLLGAESLQAVLTTAESAVLWRSAALGLVVGVLPVSHAALLVRAYLPRCKQPLMVWPCGLEELEKGGLVGLERICEVLELSEGELRAVAGVSGREVRAWRRGQSLAKPGRMARLQAACQLVARLSSRVEVERLPGVVRTELPALGGASILEAMARRSVHLPTFGTVGQLTLEDLEPALGEVRSADAQLEEAA